MPASTEAVQHVSLSVAVQGELAKAIKETVAFLYKAQVLARAKALQESS